MNIPFISYLVTSKNEGQQLQDLLSTLEKYIEGNECVILDDYSNDRVTVDILEEYKNKPNFSMYQHSLSNDYSSHKNFGKEKCKGTWIIQIDSDEIPHEYLLENLKCFLEINPTTDLFYIPRINIFQGITDSDAKMWGWNIDNPNKWVNWQSGDFQSRLFRHIPSIKWERRLHERIVGAKTYAYLPKEECFALIHKKTIKKQIETNMRYNAMFTKEENMGLN